MKRRIDDALWKGLLENAAINEINQNELKTMGLIEFVLERAHQEGMQKELRKG